MITWQPFNVNNAVRFKITDIGRKAHRINHDRFCRDTTYKMSYTPLEESDDGWCELPMWEFMKEFGPHLYPTFNVPFETNILIEIQSPCHADPQPSTPSETASEETPSRT
mgnify:FL=1